MASYRPFPPPTQSTFAPRQPTSNQSPSVPPQQQQGQGNPYTQGWGSYSQSQSQSQSQAQAQAQAQAQQQQNYSQIHPSTNYQRQGYNPPQPQNQMPPPAHPSLHQSQSQQQQQYQFPPPPPPPDSSYPPPPPSIPQRMPPQPTHAPSGTMYYQSGQYSQYSQHQPLQPPPPPPPPTSPPPSSAVPPPPPPPSSPPPPTAPPIQSKENRPTEEKGPTKDSRDLGWREPAHGKLHHASVPLPVKKPNMILGRIETEEERRLRKKREYEKQKQDEKHRQHIKEPQNRVLQKTQILSSGVKGHGSITGSHMGDRRTAPLLSGERIENRLKKPTTFLCKLKFRNELPDQTAQPKLMSLRRDKDRFTKYTITSLEKLHKPQLYVEPDLGIPLDLLDLSVYNPPKEKISYLEPEDEELLRDDDPITPIKKDGIKRKERPTDKGVSWLVKTQYISPFSMESAKQSITEKQLRESRSQNVLENLNSRERQIQEIEASFEACKARPVHATNRKLQPVEILPLFPDFDRYDDFVLANFDNAPTADSEIYEKLERRVRDAHESQAIMKRFSASRSDTAEPDKFLAYMVPSPNELSKDIYDEREDVSYSWIREYHWDLEQDNQDDPTTYLVTFGEREAHYIPLSTRLKLMKKKAREGKSSEEIEHFPIPSRLTVRKRPHLATIESKDVEDYSASKVNAFSSKRRLVVEDVLGQESKDLHDLELDQSSGAEYDMSD